MRAIKIDATAKTVSVIHLTGSSYAGMKEALNGAMLTTAGNFGKDTLFVDDVGLLKPEIVDYFHLPLFHPTPIAGNGIIVGIDGEGETVAALSDLEAIQASIRFLRKDQINDEDWRNLSAVTVSRLTGESEEVVATINIDRHAPNAEAHMAAVSAAMMGSEFERQSVPEWARVHIPDSDGPPALANDEEER